MDASNLWLVQAKANIIRLWMNTPNNYGVASFQLNRCRVHTFFYKEHFTSNLSSYLTFPLKAA